MAQVFTNSGLTVIFNQLSIGATPSSSSVTYYVGLTQGGTGTTVPAATATLATFGGAFSEMSGSGYVRQSVSFGTPSLATAYNASTPLLTTTTSASASSGSWVVTLTSTTGLLVGMSIVVGTESVKTITGINGNQVVLSSALASTQASGVTVTAGDAVSGERSAGAAVTFSATGTWPAATGYFITNTSSGTSGTAFYFSNFADASTPTLSANDTLKVTPTWLLSN